MKTIGLLGGMSWESTQPYYRIINETVRDRLGGLHSARIALHSFDFAEIAALQAAGDWAASGRLLGEAARALKGAGAEGIAICTNTMHKVAAAVEEASGLPLLHIADATAAALRAAGLERVGLLGTRFTMEGDFYTGYLRERHGIEVLIPGADARAEVHRVIYEELCRGEIRPASREAYLRVVEDLSTRGARGLVLGCTEIPMLISADDAGLPMFDTGALHARYIAEWALAGV